MPDRSYLYRASSGEYRWRRQAMNGEVVAASSEGYLRKRDAIVNYERVSGENPPILEDLTDDESSTT